MTFRGELAAEPWRFDLLATLRRFERENPSKPRLGDAANFVSVETVTSSIQKRRCGRALQQRPDCDA